jgi:RNA polymerase sigma factor (sigma-70 family)
VQDQVVSGPEDVQAQQVPPTDGFLVDQFLTTQNPAAFAALMERHGPYLLGLCRRLTCHTQDAEDVFQACFLELVRKARSISRTGSVVAWLHTVAVRLARRARLRRECRQKKEAAAVKPISINTDDLTWREVRRVLEEEVAQLPGELRSPVILCLFQELTQEEAAVRLQLNPRTLRDRLQRGRAQLRTRLTRRGITLAVLGALLSSGTTRAAVTATLQQAALQGAVAVAGKASLAGVVSPSVLGLTGSSSVFAGWGLLAATVLGVLLCASSAYLALDLFGAPAAAPVVAKASRAPHTLHRSFRNKQFDAVVFAWVGTNPDKYSRLEDEGLRITAPGKDSPPQPVGVKLRYPVRGDFDLEATLEILHVDSPKYFASGVDLYLQVDSARHDGLWLGKMKIVEQGLSICAGRIVSRDKGRVQIYHKTRPAAPETGLSRLRIVREGASFSFYSAEGEAGEYQLLDTVEIGAEELKMVRFAVEPGRQNPTGVDARLVDFSMTAQEFVGLWLDQTQP